MTTPTCALQPNWQAIEHATEMGNVWHIPSNKLPQRYAGRYRDVLLKDPCVYCGKRKAKGLDHIRPHSRGGRNGWQNRAPACTKCDQHKGCRQLLRFLIRMHNERTRQVPPKEKA